MDRCEKCRRLMSDEWFSRRPSYGADWGESHFFCEECLDLLELGQGLCEDELFRAEWQQMIKEQIAEDEGFTPIAALDGARAVRHYLKLVNAA